MVSAKAKSPREPAPRTRGKALEARERIISVAESLFTQLGFDGASMREIAAAAQMQPASVYYHFASKDELLWAVWEKGGRELVDRVQTVIAGADDPWRRFELACEAHILGLLDWRRANQILFVLPPWQYPASIRDRVIALRDEYETIFVELIAALPLRADVDRHYLRLATIGALSWSLFWYKQDGDAPSEISKHFLGMLRNGVEAPRSE